MTYKKYILLTILGLALIGAVVSAEEKLSGSSSFSPFMVSGTTIKPKVSTWGLEISSSTFTNAIFTNTTTTNATTTFLYVQKDLTVGGDANFVDVYLTNQTITGNSTTTGNATTTGSHYVGKDFTVGTTDLVVQNNGNVGIGTANPVGKLYVRGLNDATNVVAFMKGSDTGAAGTPSLNVGIGTETPGALLDIKGGVSVNPLRMIAGESNYNLAISASNHLPARTRWDFIVTNAGTPYNSMTLFDNGNVGIGDTSPNQKLGLLGTNAQISVEESDTEFLRMGVGETAGTSVIGWDDADKLYLGVYSSPTDTTIASKVTIQSDGNLGIGTTSPLTKFSIEGTAGQPVMNIASSTGASLLYISESGNVGIGMTSPSAGLHVVNSQGLLVAEEANLYAIQLQPGTTVHTITTNYFAGGSDLDIVIGTYANKTNQLYLDTSGNIGIGTTSPWANLSIDHSAGETAFAIGSSTATSFIVDASGNVGIGTESPSGIFAVGAGGGTYGMLIDSNSFISLSNNDAGTSNTIFGKNAGLSLDAGSNYNVFVGEGVSDAAMDDSTYNVGVGYSALSALTTGDNNIALGANTLLIETNGADDIAIGSSALATSNGGTKNIAIGSNAMTALTFGNHNTGVGYDVLASLTSGTGSVALGYMAGKFQLDGSSGLVTPENSVYLGYQAYSGSDPAGGEDAITNEIVIGYTAIGNGANSVTLGNTSITKTILQGNIGIGTTSPLTKFSIEGTAGQPVMNIASSTGASLLYVSEGGNVGIGTASPAVGLHIYSSATSELIAKIESVNHDATLLLDRNSVDKSSKIDFRTKDSQDWVMGSVDRGNVAGSDGDEFYIGTSVSAPKFWIESNGNLGIGTTTPTSKLVIEGTGKWGNPAAGNLLEIESDGTLVFKGDATVWNDVNVGTISLGQGATAPDQIDFATSTIKILGFNGGATTESASGCIEVPHWYKTDSDFVPHIHWITTTEGTGNVKWQMEYATSSDDTGFAGTASTTNVIVAAAGHDNTTTKSDFPTISGTGMVMEMQFCFRLFRDPTDSEDTYGDDAGAMTIGVHFEKNSLGSRTINTK